MTDAAMNRVPPPADVVPLTAVDTLRPTRGDLVEVITGVALAFAVAADGRRTPLASVPAGETIAGFAATTAGLEMIVSGLPGTTVRRHRLSDDGPGHVDRPVVERLARWVARLGEAAAGGTWPPRLLPVHLADSMVPPGEMIGPGRDHAGWTWVRVSAGSATLCAQSTAAVDQRSGTFPLPVGTWLTAGLRCRVVAVAEPRDGEQWAAALATWGALVVSAVVERQAADDLALVQRRQARDERSGAAVAEAVDTLTAAAGATTTSPGLVDPQAWGQLAAALHVARASGLAVSDDAAARASEDAASGRDPVHAAAAACGARPRAVTLTPDWWRREGSPVLVDWRSADGSTVQTRALVWRRGWVLVDPDGTSEPVDAARATAIDRRAIELLPVLPARPAGLRDIWTIAGRRSAREWTYVGAITALVSALAFFTPYLLGQVVSLFAQGSQPSAIVAVFGALMLIAVAGAAWQAMRSLALLRARSRVVAVSAGAVWDRVMRLAAPWHNARPLGERMNQVNSVNNAAAVLPDQVVVGVIDLATVFGSLIAIATAGPMMVGALGVVFVVQVLVVVVFLRTLDRRASARTVESALAGSRLIEVLRAVNRLRVAGAESRAFLRWAQAQARLTRADLRLRRTSMLQSVVLAAWPLLCLAVIVAVTAATGGDFAEFVTAQAAATAATAAISVLAASGGAALVARQLLRAAEPALTAVPEGGGDARQPGPLSGGLELRDIVFRYGPGLPPVLNRVSLRILPGEQVALVGPSGCGKTTLMRIVLGLEQSESGVVLVDGHDLAAMDRLAVRRQIGSVLQSATLLPCTIRENVAMGRHVTRDDVLRALDEAAVGEEIRALTMGIDTPVTDGGTTLSGGQRQRVLIARALVGRPRLLILDEATSALDNLTQADIVASLDALRITRIIVAHRLSTVRSADRIIVLVGGQVVDEGTYEQLIARPGPFRDLAERQQV